MARGGHWPVADTGPWLLALLTAAYNLLCPDALSLQDPPAWGQCVPTHRYTYFFIERSSHSRQISSK